MSDPSERTVTAGDGDTLCGIAMRKGFKNCEELRKLDANRNYLKRGLVAGEEVTLPEKKAKDHQGGSESLHKHEKPTLPPPDLRFVRGSRNAPAADDPELTFLNISNFISNLAGTNGQRMFTFSHEFDADADADPDVFK